MGDPEIAAAAGRDLVAWGQHQDRAALERALRAAEGPARAVARAMLDDPAAVEDATQECLLQLMRSAPRYDPKRSFHRWVGHLARTACLRWRRSEGRRRKHERAAADLPPAEQGPELAVVREAVRELPGSLRGPVELHYFSGMSQRAAAEVLGCSEGAIGVRLHRARKRLMELLRRRGIEGGASALVAALAPLSANAATTAAGATAATAVGAMAASAPATTIPLTATQQGLFMLSQYPALSAAAGLILATGISATAMTAAEAPPPAAEEPAPVVAVEPAPEPAPAPAVEPVDPGELFAPPRNGVLRLIDRESPFWLAADVARLRTDALAVPPFSLLADPRAALLVKNLQTRIDANERAAGTLSLIKQMGALGVSFEGRAGDAAGGSAIAAEVGGAEDLVRMLLTGDGDEPLEDFVIRGNADNGEIHAWQGSVVAVGERAWLATRLAAEAAAAPELPLVAEVDYGPLIADFAAMIPPEYDDRIRFMRLFLGEGWREHAPTQRMEIAIEDGAWVGRIALTGSAPTEPVDVIASISENQQLAELGSLIARTRPFDPRFRFASPPGVEPILELEFGAEMQLDLLDRAGRKPWSEEAAAALRCLTGDLRLVVVPAAPWPRATLVIGLHEEREAALEPLVAMLGDRIQSVGEGAWQLTTPGGAVFAREHADRLVVSMNPDPKAGTLPGDPTQPVPEERHLHASLDLPALWTSVRGFVAMAGAGNDQARRDLVQSLVLAGPALEAHLPRWELDLRSTDDGYEATETGLALITTLCLGAGIQIERVDPEGMRGQIEGTIDIITRCEQQPDLVAMLKRIDAALVAGDDGLIDRHAVLTAAGITPEELRTAIPGLAEWDGANPFGYLHSTADGAVRLEGRDPDTFDHHEVRTGWGRQGGRAHDAAWTIPLADGFIAHLFPHDEGEPAEGILLELREFDFTLPPPTTADDF